ncbi:MAG: hypothetical protein K9L56_14040 [Clostridiales bacterium]|nr:hypothetical protein [Clostridiales bacterium]
MSSEMLVPGSNVMEKSRSLPLGVLVRNLVGAAVITLVLFWSGFFQPGNFITASEKFDTVVCNYSQRTLPAVEKVVSAASNYTQKITDRSENIYEMHKPSGQRR